MHVISRHLYLAEKRENQGFGSLSKDVCNESTYQACYPCREEPLRHEKATLEFKGLGHFI